MSATGSPMQDSPSPVPSASPDKLMPPALSSMTLEASVISPPPAVLRLPPELLTAVLRFAHANSRRNFLNNAMVCREWAASALPVLWERIAPRSNFPLVVIIRALEKLWRTLSTPNPSRDYASFPRAVAIQLHLRNNEVLSRRVVEDFQRVVELVPSIIKTLPKVRDLGLTLRVEEISAPLQATATAFLERLVRVQAPEKSLWIKLAGLAVLDSQCAALAERFGSVVTDFHLTKCMGCTAAGLRYFLQRAPRLQSLALYIPSLHDQLLGVIALHNHQLQDLWLDLPMEEGAPPQDDDGLRNFCTDLRLLLQRSTRLRRLRLRGVPLPADRAQQMLEVIGAEGSEIRSLSILVWPPEPMGNGMDRISCPNLTKLIISSNSRLSTDFIMAVARSCPLLQVLDAGRTRIDDACIRELATRCRLLDSLDISRCAHPTALALTYISEHGSGMLRSLDVSFCTKILRADDQLGVAVVLLAEKCRALDRFCIDYAADAETSELVRALFGRFGSVGASGHVAGGPPAGGGPADAGERKRQVSLGLVRQNWRDFLTRAQANTMVGPTEAGWAPGGAEWNRTVEEWMWELRSAFESERQSFLEGLLVVHGDGS